MTEQQLENAERGDTAMLGPLVAEVRELMARVELLQFRGSDTHKFVLQIASQLGIEASGVNEESMLAVEDAIETLQINLAQSPTETDLAAARAEVERMTNERDNFKQQAKDFDEELEHHATDTNLSRRLCELMEPEPRRNKYDEVLSLVGWWTSLHGEWQPVHIDDNAMRRVREELRRRGLYDQYVKALRRACRVEHLSNPTQILGLVIGAARYKQIEAAVEVLESAK